MPCKTCEKRLRSTWVHREMSTRIIPRKGRKNSPTFDRITIGSWKLTMLLQSSQLLILQRRGSAGTGDIIEEKSAKLRLSHWRPLICPMWGNMLTYCITYGESKGATRVSSLRHTAPPLRRSDSLASLANDCLHDPHIVPYCILPTNVASNRTSPVRFVPRSRVWSWGSGNTVTNVSDGRGNFDWWTFFLPFTFLPVKFRSSDRIQLK